MKKTAIGTTVESGELCPESGEWEPEHYPNKAKVFKKGAKMPPVNYMAANWKLTKYEEG